MFLCAGLNLNTLVFENVSFSGAAVAEYINGFPGDRTIWSGAGSTAQAPTGFTYVVRLTQFDPNGQDAAPQNLNVQTDGDFPQFFYTAFTQNDWSQSTDGTDDLDSTRECSFMINRRAAAWLINPIFGGRTMPVTNHTGQASILQQPTEIRQFVGWRPIGRDAQTNAHVADYMLLTPENSNSVRRLVQLPAGFTYDGNTVPAAITTAVAINDANYLGLWVESDLSTYTATQAGIATIQENVLNGNNRAWSFTHDVVHEFAIPTFTVTTANGETSNILGSNANAFIGFEEDSRTGMSLAAYLNGHANAVAAPSPTTAVDNIGDIFPAIRSDWYTRRVQGVFTPTGTGGNNCLLYTSPSPRDS